MDATMPSLQEYDYVELQVGLSPDLPPGVRGTVLLVYPGPKNDYEVEFVDASGSTLGVETVNGSVLCLVPS